MEVEGGGRRGVGSGNGGAAVAVLEEEEQDLGRVCGWGSRIYTMGMQP